VSLGSSPFRGEAGFSLQVGGACRRRALRAIWKDLYGELLLHKDSTLLPEVLRELSWHSCGSSSTGCSPGPILYRVPQFYAEATDWTKHH